MAPEKEPQSSSPIHIGNCQVTVEPGNFTFESDSQSLRISVSRKSKINISVKDDESGNESCDLGISNPNGNGKEQGDETCGEEYCFVLVNPKDTDGCSKSLIQEILKLYMKELPAMNYAANTGKESRFLERCISNGKFCTLLLSSKSKEGIHKVLGAITYRMIPVDMQFAEIPLAAVSSTYQYKGIGRLLFMELRNRLQSVGVNTILCWGDKESEGFWLKLQLQGFISVAEVGTKGRARRLPIRADIQRALCFPGGSTLMISHLNNNTTIDPSQSLTSCIKGCKMFSSFTCIKLQGIGHAGQNCMTLNVPTRIENSQPEQELVDSFSVETNKFDDNNAGGVAERLKGEAEKNMNRCNCSMQGKRARIWEATLSSLKSKKVRGSEKPDSHGDCGGDLLCRCDKSDFCLNQCSMGNSVDPTIEEASNKLPSSCNYVGHNKEKCNPLNLAAEAPVNNDVTQKAQSFRIMLMDIADDNKKSYLAKVIEDLGGIVAPEGSESTHVITKKARRTLNFCTALSSGAWIVSSSWLKESFRQGRFVDELPHILSDEEYASKYRSDLRSSVLRSKARPKSLLKGYNVRIAPHVQPPAKTLGAIVVSAGGYVIRGVEKVKEPSKTIFIACEEDMEEALAAVKKGIWTFSSDWFMTCIMRQELDLESPQFAESL